MFSLLPHVWWNKVVCVTCHQSMQYYNQWDLNANLLRCSTHECFGVEQMIKISAYSCKVRIVVNSVNEIIFCTGLLDNRCSSLWVLAYSLMAVLTHTHTHTHRQTVRQLQALWPNHFSPDVQYRASIDALLWTTAVCYGNFEHLQFLTYIPTYFCYCTARYTADQSSTSTACSKQAIKYDLWSCLSLQPEPN